MTKQQSINSWALITGATSGIGKAYALLLAREGYNMLLTGRREHLLHGVAEEITKMGNQVEVLVGDLTEDNVLEHIIKIAKDLNLKWIVNNAGYGTDSPFFSESSKSIATMIELHTRVPIEICRSLIPQMMKNAVGFVVNVSSLASQFPLPGSLVYTSTKAMLHHFSLSLSLELNTSGVRVQSFLPGFTHTDFHDRLSHFNHERRSRGIVQWQNAEDAVRSSYNAITSRKWHKITHVPGWRNHLLKLTGKLPFWFYRIIALKVQK
jgi:short-subunit dehydrogenase